MCGAEEGVARNDHIIIAMFGQCSARAIACCRVRYTAFMSLLT
jgi:hypothetical protein